MEFCRVGCGLGAEADWGRASGALGTWPHFNFQAYRPDAEALLSRSWGEGGSSTPRRCDHLAPVFSLATIWVRRIGHRTPPPLRGGPDRDLLEGGLRQGLLADVFLCRPRPAFFLGPVLGEMLANF